MPSIQELQPPVTEPREALDAEYKGWLDLTTIEHTAVLAKAAVACANHGGGYIIMGLEDPGHQLVGSQRPAALTETAPLAKMHLRQSQCLCPPVGQQHWFDRLQTRADQARAIHASTVRDVEVLIPAMLHEVFNGKAPSA